MSARMDPYLPYPEAKDAILEYLRTTRSVMSYHVKAHGLMPYVGIADLVLRHGRIWGPANVSGPRGSMKQCFSNCQIIATRDPAFLYVEGYALSVIPMHHAWLVHRETGFITDPTWKTSSGAYVGVPIRTDYLRSLMLRTGYAAAVFDNWVDDPPQPILDGRHPVRDWLQTPFEFGEEIPC